MNETPKKHGLIHGLNNAVNGIFTTIRLTVAVTVSAVLLAACTAGGNPTSLPGQSELTLRCHNAEQYAGRVIGDGHCVSLIKLCSGAPDTDHWRPGEYVLNEKVFNEAIPSGTIIATFERGRYPNRHGHHAAIYISHDDQGIWVWDQWVGKPVHQRLIKLRSDDAPASNSAQNYRVVEVR